MSSPQRFAHTVHATVPLPFGEYIVRADGDVLTGVFRVGQRHLPSQDRLGVSISAQGPQSGVIELAIYELMRYARGELTSFSVPFKLNGTPFQRKVWEALSRIPYGKTTTYGELAAEIGVPRAAQAVGAAVGANPVSIIVPCHRVIGATGSLTGYAGGLDTKRALLQLESHDRDEQRRKL
ncbi:methylated-DNA--[protein]-cysteine S-methyltransferase [Devriesea agamarum]|uniref:methylated-DNA--[protein]-cysteine S-methyltransferase n=1 Tax=Devriesea agamarum TaxID=472569 RepID=UPI0022B23648|nr:methylated-DNA--[protein]-cysteine S-methyltransferase [Devriesea agamarum]